MTLNASVARCPTRNGRPVFGLLDCFILLAEAYSQIRRLRVAIVHVFNSRDLIFYHFSFETALKCAKAAVDAAHQRLNTATENTVCYNIQYDRESNVTYSFYLILGSIGRMGSLMESGRRMLKMTPEIS